jgi:outer membrane protein assembly factor BamB
MHTLKRLLKWAGITAVVLAVTGAVLYQFFGLRVVVYGGNSVRLAFVQSPAAQAEAIEEHRKAQASTSPAELPVPAAPVPTATATPEPGAAAVTSSSSVFTPSSWPDFRGPKRDGHYIERPVLTTWPNGQLKPVWKQPVGGGYASFVTARMNNNELAFTIEQRGPQEVVAAYDVITGRELWTAKWNAEFKEFMGGDGPRATPTYYDGYVYALGAAGEFRALDASSGRTIWRTNILTDAGAANIQWGMATSPLIVDDHVVVQPGGTGGKSVAAYNHRTGTRAWSSLDDRAAYSSPMLVTIDGVRQILAVTASRMVGLATKDGALLWDYPWVTMADVNAAQPVLIGTNRVFISSAYDKGAAVIEVSMAATRGTVTEVWKNNRMKNQFSSSVLHEGHLYGLDESILACIDAGTGALKWKGGRYGYGQIVLAGGHIFVLTEDGELALVRATPDKHVELARFPVLDGKTWNHPVFSDGRLLIRNVKEMALFDLRR